MWCYSPIYVRTGHQLSVFTLSLPSRPYVFAVAPLITITCVGWWVELCSGWTRTLPGVPFLLYPPIVFFTFCVLYLWLWGFFSIGKKVQESPETSPLHSCSRFHTQSKHGGQLQHLTMLTINHPLDCETQRDMASIGNSGQCFLLSSSFLVFSLILLSDSLFAVLLGFHCCISPQQRTLQSLMLLFFLCTR